MTRKDFNDEFGADWRKFSNRPMFAALLQLMDNESPARGIPALPDGDKLHGAAVHLNRVDGWERARAFLQRLADVTPAEIEPKITFAEPERF